MDAKMGAIEQRIGKLDAIEHELTAMNASLASVDARLGGLAAIDSGIARTNASVVELQRLTPAIETLRLELEGVQAKLGRVAGNDELVRVDSRLAEQLVALGETKAQLHAMNERLATLPELSSELKAMNKELASVATLATEAHGEARDVLAWRTVALAIAAAVVSLHLLSQWRLQKALADSRRDV
jgi:chromosome segregation ATPase